MKQLQAWANKGWYTFPCEQHPEGDFDGDGWEDLYNIESNFRYNLADAVDCVLDGTIQVWRPVEHYPLIENNKPVILWRKGIRNGIVAVWSLEFGSCFTDCEWRDFKTQEIIEDIEDYTHWMPFEPPQEVSHV
jgi:hypothetical protein